MPKIIADLHLTIEGNRIADLYNEIQNAEVFLKDILTFKNNFPMLAQLQNECLETIKLTDKLNGN